MIGRSLVIFQFGNNKNELHECCSWSFALGLHDKKKDIDKRIVKEYKKKKWKPEDVVDDAEVEAIVNATNCIGPKEPGYHQWASDGVHIINLSGDPNLYNPAAALAERRRIAEKKRQKALHRLKGFIPELVKLRNAIPTGEITLDVTLQVKVEVAYSVSSPISSVYVFNKNGKEQVYSSRLIDRDQLAKQQDDRCRELADELGLCEEDVENETFLATMPKSRDNHDSKS
jgi:hypothetical protein